MTRQKRRAARYGVSGKRRNASGRARGSAEGREKLVTGGVARALWYTYRGANRSYPVADFSPVKQVSINDPWYQSAPTYLMRVGSGCYGSGFADGVDHSGINRFDRRFTAPDDVMKRRVKAFAFSQRDFNQILKLLDAKTL